MIYVFFRLGDKKLTIIETCFRKKSSVLNENTFNGHNFLLRGSLDAHYVVEFWTAGAKRNMTKTYMELKLQKFDMNPACRLARRAVDLTPGIDI
jgi:hypothetical protein